MKLHSSNTARNTILGIAAFAALLVAGSAAAADEFKLAMKSGCLVCHRGVEKKIGPPYAEVAKKYAGEKDAEALLAEHIMKGTGPDGLGWAKDGKASLPFMPPNDKVSPENAAKLANWVLGIRAEIFDPLKFVTTSIAVSGAVLHKLTLSVDDLKKFPPQQIGETPVVCQSGATISKMDSAKGILLRDILGKAGIVTHAPNDVKKMVIIATASDGYKVVFSWTEVFNSPIGDGVIVFYERNGMPLTDDEGRIAMISTKDIRTGPRHVNWLTEIEVRKIVD